MSSYSRWRLLLIDDCLLPLLLLCPTPQGTFFWVGSVLFSLPIQHLLTKGGGFEYHSYAKGLAVSISRSHLPETHLPGRLLCEDVPQATEILTTDLLIFLYKPVCHSLPGSPCLLNGTFIQPTVEVPKGGHSCSE